MEKVERGELLDFTRIRRFYSMGAPSRIVSISPQVRQDIRRKFEKVMEMRPGMLQLDPKPRFDSLFWDRVTDLYADEQSSIRPGEVEISGAIKKEIHDQSGQE